MSSKKLSFKLGQEKNRGELYTRHSNITENTVVSFEEGQTLFSYSEIDSTKYPYKPYDHTYKTKSSKDARIYIDLSNERIPISSYFSDYSSKLWDLSSGAEFNVGNSLESIYFKNGIPKKGRHLYICEERNNGVQYKINVNDADSIIWEKGLEISILIPQEHKNNAPLLLQFYHNGTRLDLDSSVNWNKDGTLIPIFADIPAYTILDIILYNANGNSSQWIAKNFREATTQYYGQTKLYDDFDSTATNLAATANSVHKIVNESLLFTGNKTLEGKLLIRTKELNSVLDSNQNDAFCIYSKNTSNGYTTRLYLDSAGISSTSQANNSNEQFSSLYLNTEGGNLILGPQLLINNNTIQALLKYDEEEPNDLYLNPDGGIIKTSQININPKEIESLPYENATVDNHLIVGDLTDAYIAIDTDDIQAISADYPSELYLNFDGGIIHLGSKIDIEEDGQVYMANETQSDSSDTGALIVKGGIGVSKTSYMTSILPDETMTSQLGGFDNVWKYIFSNKYLIHDGTNGHFSSDYTGGSIETEIGTATNGTLKTQITLGNALTGKIGNRKGVLRLYSTSSGYTDILKRTGATSATSFYLPNSTGYAVWNPNSTAVGSTSLPAYVSSQGQVTVCDGSKIFSKLSSSSNTLSITVAGEAKTVSMINTISNTWVDGEASGPTLTTTVNGVSGTAIAIPSASGSTSGVVTTGTQTFTGEKTFSNKTIFNGQVECANTTAFLIMKGPGIAVSKLSDTTTTQTVLYNHKNGNISLSAIQQSDGSSNGNLYLGYYNTASVNCGPSTSSPWLKVESTGTTINTPLFINSGANKIDIANRGDTWCHIYNENSVPFIFNKDIYTIGCLGVYYDDTHGWSRGAGTGNPSTTNAKVGQIYFKIIS